MAGTVWLARRGASQPHGHRCVKAQRAASGPSPFKGSSPRAAVADAMSFGGARAVMLAGVVSDGSSARRGRQRNLGTATFPD
jgi:hypothetical protein